MRSDGKRRFGRTKSMQPAKGTVMRRVSAYLALLLTIAMLAPDGAHAQSSALRDLADHEVSRSQLRSAVASRALTWLTGTPANNDYISVGRMANFFGFVALRVSSGQSLTRAHVARDTLAVLTPSQVDRLAEILDAQIPAHRATQDARIEMNRALERLLVGETVDEGEFLALGRIYGASEAELGRVIGQGFGEIAVSLSPEQQVALARIREGHASGTPVDIRRSGQALQRPGLDRKELVNLAARFLSWTTGSPEFNDFEVVGKPSQHFGFVSLRLASGHAARRGAVAQDVLGLLTREQKRLLDAAVDQNLDAFQQFLSVRGQLMRTLEVALDGQDIDAETVRRFGEEVGEIEAGMTWAQASAMLNVRDALSEAQLSELVALRARYTATVAETDSHNSVERGRQLFAQCALCHAATRDAAIAPGLTGVVGRPIASDTAFKEYSPGLKALAATESAWNPDLLNRFLRSPRSLVPGTTMGFDGISDPQDREAMLAYLATLE